MRLPGTERCQAVEQGSRPFDGQDLSEAPVDPDVCLGSLQLSQDGREEERVLESARPDVADELHRELRAVLSAFAQQGRDEACPILRDPRLGEHLRRLAPQGEQGITVRQDGMDLLRRLVGQLASLQGLEHGQPEDDLHVRVPESFE